jgi:hypothetical protein
VISSDNAAAGQSMVEMHKAWNPPAPGNYTLRVRAQEGQGAWSDYAVANVTILGPTQTPTITPTATAITITPTPVTNTPTPLTITPTPLTPTPTTPSSNPFTPSVSTNQFYYGSCSPNSVTVGVQVEGLTGVNSVILFQMLQGQDWDDGTSMAPQGKGIYVVTITGNSVPAHANYSQVNWIYEFVATDRSGQVIGRSPRYTDVNLGKCGNGVHINPVAPIKPPFTKFITPIAPPGGTGH